MKKYENLDSNVLLFQKETNSDKRDVLFELIWKDVVGLIYQKTPMNAIITEQQADWRQEAAISLLECIDKFNPNFKGRFVTYFFFYLKQARNTYFEKGGSLIKFPRLGKLEDIPKISFPDSESSVKSNENHRPFSGNKIESRHARASAQNMPWDLIPIDYARDIKLIEQRLDFDKLKIRLRPQELDVLLLVMEGLIYKEIAKKLGYNNRERVRQIYEDAIAVCMRKERPSLTIKKKQAEQTRLKNKQLGVKK